MNAPTPSRPQSPSDETLRAWLSDLADGHADPEAAQGACAAWRDSAQVRQTWHSYHLIGDVLRSEELARPAQADAAFLARLRERLAQEPVVLAPAPLPQVQAQPARRQRQRWLVPMAAAAGFVAVAGVLVVTRLAGPELGESGPMQVRTEPQGPGLILVDSASRAAAGAGSLTMLRDARLDAYLNAHQSARGFGAAAVPGAGLRPVESVVQGQPQASLPEQGSAASSAPGAALR